MRYAFRAGLFSANSGGELLQAYEGSFEACDRDHRQVALEKAVEALEGALKAEPTAKAIRLQYVRPV